MLPSRPQDETSYAAVPHAARKGHVGVLRLLLQRGGDPWAHDSDGYTAYDYVIDQGRHPDVLAVLLEHDQAFARQQQQFQSQYARMCQLLKRTQRFPALGCACRTCGSVVEIRSAETDASRLARDSIGCVALVRAVQAGGQHSVAIMQMLLQHGALIDGQVRGGGGRRGGGRRGGGRAAMPGLVLAL